MAEKRFSFRKFLGLAFAVSLVVLLIWQAEIATDNSTYKINQKVESIGGTVLSIDMKSILEDTPFFRGKHTVVFKFEPVSVAAGSKVDLVSSVLLIALIAGAVFVSVKGKAS